MEYNKEGNENVSGPPQFRFFFFGHRTFGDGIALRHGLHGAVQRIERNLQQ
jgi:hypothetical protein